MTLLTNCITQKEKMIILYNYLLYFIHFIVILRSNPCQLLFQLIMNSENQELLEKQFNKNKPEDQNIPVQILPSVTFNEIQNLNPVTQNNISSINDLGKTTITLKKMQSIKKIKPTIFIYEQFIPQFLLELNLHKQKSIIRIGKNYQANVPKKCNYSYIYRPLKQQKLWTPGQFHNVTFKKFKQKFGQNRSQQDLCLLMHFYQSDWDQINTYMNQHKVELRKCYLQKDRTKQ